MDFTGKICPYCKTEFKEDDEVVVCSVCEMPHHKECWIENKACTTFGCTGTMVGDGQQVDDTTNCIFCPQCGKQIEDGHKFCSFCGTPIGFVGEAHFRAAGAYTQTQSHQQNTYTQSQQYTPQYNAGYNQYGSAPYIDNDLYSFIQINQSAYVSKFQKMNLTNTKTSWNWCSFLCGSYWYAYRKMYGFSAGYIGIALLCGFIPVLGIMLNIALSICSGIFGDYFYKQYIDNELRMAKSMNNFNKNEYIAQKGGTSIGAVFAMIGICFALVFIINFL